MNIYSHVQALLKYDSAPGVTSSDHKPVMGLFQCEWVDLLLVVINCFERCWGWGGSMKGKAAALKLRLLKMRIACSVQ